MKEALWYNKREDGGVQCRLCPHACVIAPGQTGRCRIRRNTDGALYAETFEKVSAVAMDPIEKKPLYHFHPGREILSIGGIGCNFTCTFCQNWEISQGSVSLQEFKVADAVKWCKDNDSIGIAYTYNEPLIQYEFVLETARAIKEEGLRNAIVTNGFINPKPLDALLPYIDAMNIDIKSIRDEFYRDICGGRLKPVLEAATRAKKNVHVEITNLIIPGCNDTDEEFKELARWIAANLGPETPVHLSAYTPRHQLQAPPTPMETLEKPFDIFGAELYFVYLGNASSDVGANTRCINCGEMHVRRQGYYVEVLGIDREGMCNHCQGRSYIIT